MKLLRQPVETEAYLKLTQDSSLILIEIPGGW